MCRDDRCQQQRVDLVDENRMLAGELRKFVKWFDLQERAFGTDWSESASSLHTELRDLRDRATAVLMWVKQA